MSKVNKNNLQEELKFDREFVKATISKPNILKEIESLSSNEFNQTFENIINRRKFNYSFKDILYEKSSDFINENLLEKLNSEEKSLKQESSSFILKWITFILLSRLES